MQVHQHLKAGQTLRVAQIDARAAKASGLRFGGLIHPDLCQLMLPAPRWPCHASAVWGCGSRSRCNGPPPDENDTDSAETVAVRIVVKVD